MSNNTQELIRLILIWRRIANTHPRISQTKRDEIRRRANEWEEILMEGQHHRSR